MTGLLTGFAAAEKTERVASVLRPGGADASGFARLVLVLGHGSTQPEQSARIGPRLRSMRRPPRRPQRTPLRRHGQPARSSRRSCASEVSTFRRTPGSSAVITIPAAMTWSSMISTFVPARPCRPI